MPSSIARDYPVMRLLDAACTEAAVSDRLAQIPAGKCPTLTPLTEVMLPHPEIDACRQCDEHLAVVEVQWEGDTRGYSVLVCQHCEAGYRVYAEQERAAWTTVQDEDLRWVLDFQAAGGTLSDLADVDPETAVRYVIRVHHAARRREAGVAA